MILSDIRTAKGGVLTFQGFPGSFMTHKSRRLRLNAFSPDMWG